MENRSSNLTEQFNCVLFVKQRGREQFWEQKNYKKKKRRRFKKIIQLNRIEFIYSIFIESNNKIVTFFDDIVEHKLQTTKFFDPKLHF